MDQRRMFAILPAAGASRRMGRPKLLLPLGDSTVIARLVRALIDGGVDEVLVVVRPSDERLRHAAEEAGAYVVRPDVDPADMRQSVQFALDDLNRRESPDDRDGWMLIPADHPLLEPEIVRDLLTAWRRSDAPILIPTHAGRRGHPTLFRWSLASAVPGIAPHQGLNRLVKTHADDVIEYPVDSDHILMDMDTLEDYERLQVEYRRKQA